MCIYYYHHCSSGRNCINSTRYDFVDMAKVLIDEVYPCDRVFVENARPYGALLVPASGFSLGAFHCENRRYKHTDSEGIKWPCEIDERPHRPPPYKHFIPGKNVLPITLRFIRPERIDIPQQVRGSMTAIVQRFNLSNSEGLSPDIAVAASLFPTPPAGNSTQRQTRQLLPQLDTHVSPSEELETARPEMLTARPGGSPVSPLGPGEGVGFSLVNLDQPVSPVEDVQPAGRLERE